MIKPPISDLVTQHDGIYVDEENTETIDGVKTFQPATLYIIPTGEEVLVERKQISYKGILASNQDNLNNSRSQEINVIKKMKKNSTSSKQKKSDTTQTPMIPLPLLDKEKSLLLTDYDVKNRLRGYSLFLPETKEECDEYWRVAYGVNLYSEYTEIMKRNFNGNKMIVSDEMRSVISMELNKKNINSGYKKVINESGMISAEKEREEREGEGEGGGGEGKGEGEGGGYNLSEVTMQLGDKRILPSQMLAR